MNFIQYPKGDKKGGCLEINHEKAHAVLQMKMEEHEVVDVWRILNPEANRCTWRQYKPKALCRLDYFIISTGLLGRRRRTDIEV